MWPFDEIGSVLGEEIRPLLEAAMLTLWEASLAILRAAFAVADQFSLFTVDTRSGPVSVLWPMMLWISGILALSLFFWQITVTSLRGGRGFLRLVIGPAQYGIALAVTVGMVAAFLAATDGLTQGILEYGLQSRNFQEALNATAIGDGVVDGVKAVVLGICAIFGVIPAAIGFVLEMLFREAAIYGLVATIPITAAGLLARITVSWYWTALRLIIVCCIMKPALALALVLGVAIAGGSQGLSGLLAGIGVLLIALLAPFLLFRLFAFVDGGSDAAGVFRDALSMAGVDSYGSNNPAVKAASEAAALYGGGDGEGDAQESANTGRFDDAASHQDESPDARPKSTPNPANSNSDSNSGDSDGSGGPSGGGGGESGGYGGPEGTGGPSAPPPDPGTDTDDTDTDADSNTGGGGRPNRPAANHGRAAAPDGLGPQRVGGSGGSDDATLDDGDDAGGGTGGEQPPPEAGGPAVGGDGSSGGRSAVAPAPTSEMDTGADDGSEAPPVGGSGAASAPGEGSGGDEPPPPQAPDASGHRPSPGDHGTGTDGADAAAAPPTPSAGEPPAGEGGSQAPPDHGTSGTGGGSADGADPSPPDTPDPPDPGPGPKDGRGGGNKRGPRHGGQTSSDDDSGDDGAEGVVPV